MERRRAPPRYNRSFGPMQGLLDAESFPMSLASYLPLPNVPPARLRRGRPCVALDPSQRSLHIQVAIHRLVYRNTVEQVCNRFGISPRTVSLWTGKALGYDEPEAEALRRLRAT